MMKYIIGIVLIIGALAWALIAAAAPGGQTKLTFADIEKDMATKGAKLVDVRTTQEYAEGHIEGAVNIPVESIQAGASVPVDSKDTPVYVYCRSGNRSAAAKSALEQQGYTNITDLGAMTEVSLLGGKTVTTVSL